MKPRLVSVVAVALVLLAPAQVGALVARRDAGARPVAKATPSPEPTSSPASSASAEPSPSPSQTQTAPSPSPVAGRAAVFSGLGTWIDVYDYAGLDPATAARTMAAHGVRTLYLETGRFKDAASIHAGAADWVRAAHSAGLKIVGWYLPDHANLSRDTARTIAVAKFRAGAQRFDGVAIDAEYHDAVPDASTWNARMLRHVRAVRDAIGGAPLMMISVTPAGMQRGGARFAGFPWRAVAANVDAFALMGYWTFRAAECRTNAALCAGPYTSDNISRALAAAGTGTSIHMIGGLAGDTDAAQVRAFVSACDDAHVLGASLYDFRTTSNELWREMASLS
jgi:hypothetical protein